ncbi:hypothetical protein RPO70_06515, partial [Staphylococcus arlettae]|uniref:hypothetical protein n=1 Tax=Staphylococcus arlettae TaxID=29378 RepID=UPI0028A507CC
AKLVNAGNIIAADSFGVAVEKDGDRTNIDPDDDNDGKTDEGFVAGESQNLTHGVQLVDSMGKPVENSALRDGIVLSDGNKATQDELTKVEYTLPSGATSTPDLTGVKVTLADAAGTAVDSGSTTSWLGSKGYPAVQNFGLADFTK